MRPQMDKPNKPPWQANQVIKFNLQYKSIKTTFMTLKRLENIIVYCVSMTKQKNPGKLSWGFEILNLQIK